MRSSSLSNTIIDTFNNDFKAEVIAAEMVDNGLSADRIMIMLLGPSKRSFRKDVDAVTKEISNYDHKEFVLVKTYKEGIYDMLPEGLFHFAALPKSATTEKDILDFMKQHEMEEANARRFFLPFEAAISYVRIQMVLYENKLDKGSYHNDLVDIFSDHWDIFKYLDSSQANIFLQILPLIHDIRDNYRVAETVFELIFLLPITISLRQRPIKCDVPILSTLDDCRLGINFTTGNTIYDSGEDEIVVNIGPIDNKQLNEFMPAEKKGKILELICDYLLPAHIEITVEFELYGRDKITRLADKETDFNSTLGLSTYL